MRQSGIIAAAGIVALESMIDRMADDHANAKKLAEGLSGVEGISIDPAAVQSNLVFIQVDAPDHMDIAQRLDERGVRVGARPGGIWRLVTHNDVSSDDIDYALEVVESTFQEAAAGA